MAPEPWYGDHEFRGVVMLGGANARLAIPVLAADPANPDPGWLWVNATDETFNLCIVDDVTIVLPLTGGGDADTLDGEDGTFYLARANHTGTQAAATISDLTTTVQGIVNAMSLNATTIEGSDVDTLIAAAIAGVVDSAPAALNTLNELADALGDDPNFAATLNAALALRDRSVMFTTAGGALTENLDHNLGSYDVGVLVRTNAGDRQDVHFRPTRPTVNRLVLNSDSDNIPAGLIALVSLKAHA